MSQKIAHCHKRIRDVAMGLAGGTYDMLMSDNRIYDEWKRQNPDLDVRNLVCRAQLRERFIKKNWSKHIDAARTTLGLLLREPIDDKTKEEIVTILALDQTLMRGRLNPSVILGSVSPRK